MGRGRVQLKKIDNKINRQVTFSKRRVGLTKKAHELSVLTEAQVGLIIFSQKGKLFEYSTDSCMDKILERYESYSFAERQLTNPDPDPQGNWNLECYRLKAKAEFLQKNLSHYRGENLDSLSFKELQNLEPQIENSLKLVRSKIIQQMHDDIVERQRRQKALQEENYMLENQIKQIERSVGQHQLPCLNIGGIYQNEGSGARRNDLELTLEPVYFGCFGN